MKKVIYYFSGTGNSLRAAIKIAEEIGGAEIVSVRCNSDEIMAQHYDVIGFVCPVYEWDIPGAMREFVEKLKINSDAYIFMVATYIAVHGRCFETMAELLNAKGVRLCYSRAIRCVASQCVAYPPFPPEKLMIPYMERMMKKVGKEIGEKKERAYPHMSFLTRKLYPKVMGPYMEVEKEYDKGFFADERCIGCGVCAKVCPTQNITLQQKRPTWNHHCHGCNACVVYCPMKAVQFKTPPAYEKLGTFISKRLGIPPKRKRYHHPFIKANDLMTDRRCILPQNEEENEI